jgi:GNAT superfamily N-acetyltransferase
MEPLKRPGVRDLQPGDVEGLVELISATGTFRPEEIEVARELLAAGAERGEESGYSFRVAVTGDAPDGYACFGPTPCTRGTFDLYWIAVHPDAQGRGVATALLAAVEEAVRLRAGRLLVAETEEAPPYDSARRFYELRGFSLAANVPDFYRPGAAKLIYTKPLASLGGQ